MIYCKEIKWIEPIEVGYKISQNYDDDFYLLYSALHDQFKGSKSYIGLFLRDKKHYNNIMQLPNFKFQHGNKLALISYESNAEDIIASNHQSHIDFCNVIISDFALNAEFDHDDKRLKIYYDNKNDFKLFLSLIAKKKRDVVQDIRSCDLSSNFSDQSYINAINDIKKRIGNGDFYQVNLTRKFYGKLVSGYGKDNLYHNFVKLCHISPANYSAFITIDKKIILSSSPELFLQASDKNIISRPIKGTINRRSDQKKDKKNMEYLQNSHKERAENLMIVDLVRNDLSTICNPNSVKVNKLFSIDSYKLLYHMSSEISGVLKNCKNYKDVIIKAFPPGSMTGAPKIAAMNKIKQSEKVARGIYSGSIGIIGQDMMKLSVVIRTLIIDEKSYEFQVGGAITHDSVATKELEEIYHKAQAIANILNIDSWSG